MTHEAGCEETLAVDGGMPVRTIPLPPWPVFENDEIEAVAAVLRSGKVNYWTGTQGRCFEEEFAQAVGCRHAVAVANGSVALELALEALGIGAGDEVIVTSRSFIASASCCVRRGAVPVFADVDPVSQNITADTVRAVLSSRTKAIIAVHLAGWPCEMDPIMQLAAEHGLRVVEDCAQALGATYRGRPVGSLGHAAAFSFCQDKILTTGGEGGMLTTNDRSVWERAWSIKDHGKSWTAVNHPGNAGIFRWLHESFGTNYRMTEMQAAVGRVMLRKLPRWVATRRRHAAWLDERLDRLPQLRVTTPPHHAGHGYYKYYVFLRPECLRAGWSRDRFARAVQAERIPCGSGACSEIYLEKVFEDSPWRLPRRLPVARELGRTSLMLLVHPTLSKRDVQDTCRAVEKVACKATVGVPAAKRAA
jgi:dTDP-4-amino-4,6-dideoxygalactose transaminase